jgi:alginate O-acetyltransferase complex protein AlgI
MIFTSITFLISLAFIVPVYYLLPFKFRPSFLLFVSYWLYYEWCPEYIYLLTGVSVLTYFGGLSIEYSRKKGTLFVFFVSILSLIFLFFKYRESIMEAWPETEDYLKSPTEKILLPLGISFFSFQSLSYLIDVFRKRINAEMNPVNVLLFISFFPQLVAGPIEKAAYLIPELKRQSKLRYENIMEGGKLLLFGFFKKIVVADTLSFMVIPGYENLNLYSGKELWILGLVYVYYIYADFSGYSDLAHGTARLFGIRLTINFFKPFSSLNIREFWSRWHMTLYNWIREYIFFPTKASYQQAKTKIYVKIILVFVCIGLWHGATTNFLVYGSMAGVMVLMSHLIKNPRKRFFRSLERKSGKALGHFIQKAMTTIQFSTLALFFASSDSQKSFEAVGRILSGSAKEIGNQLILQFAIIALSLEVLQFFQRVGSLHPFAGLKSLWLRFSVYLIMLFSILLLCNRDPLTFIYFRF